MKLLDFSQALDPDRINTTNALVRRVSTEQGHALEMRCGIRADYPGVYLLAPEGRWDVSGYGSLMVDVTNAGDQRVTVGFRVDTPGAEQDSSKRLTVIKDLDAGETATFDASLCPTPYVFSEPVDWVGMRNMPGVPNLDCSNITQVIVFAIRPGTQHTLRVNHLRAERPLVVRDVAEALPLIDEFGQLTHRDWPGKILMESDLFARRDAEEKELAAHPGPEDRSPYGGWKTGPRLEATGAFRVEKVGGKWGLVDPEGYLFWSKGIDCVDARFGGTPISHRENYFSKLPTGETWERFYDRNATWAPTGFYQDKIPFTMYGFYRANLFRKYGENDGEHFIQLAHRRLKSWGMTTVGNWGDPQVHRRQQTPYVTGVWINATPKIEGAESYWYKFHDVFDPQFRETVRAAFAQESEAAADPWCIGFFVDNEMSWGRDTSLAEAALVSPAGQAAKNEFLGDLQERYATMDALNKVWGTDYASWAALLESQEAPDPDKARSDLLAFNVRLAETYFRIVREEQRAVAPDRLYLGCRFAWQNDVAVRASVKYCDVVSFNKYEYSVADLDLPDGADRPVLIGEFHFGSTDRGMFNEGIRGARDQADRGEKYKHYMKSALEHPLIVGAHWFQYMDESASGRADGENYNVGFIDTCDTPYSELITAAREVGYGMYTTRWRGIEK